MAKKQQEQPIKINSFFAGIGGFDLGFERQGFRTMMLCENDPFCNRILNRHWPDVQKELDIRNVAAEDIPEAPVWCGGFPCQDISVARGKNERLGLQGERSGLFYDYARLIEQCHPEVVMIENVEGLFSSNQGRDFGIILQCMTEMGYAVAWRKINSRYFGVPQSRKRTYVCCWRNSMAKAVRVMFDNEGAPKVHNERLGFITEASEPGAYPKVPLVSYCISATTGRHTGTDWSRTYVVCHNGVRRMTPIECERLQGFPDNWTQPNIEEVQEDINSSRYKTLGNAVSVPVIEWIASRIRTELTEPVQQMSEEDVKLFVPEFARKNWSETKLSEMDFDNPDNEFDWPNGGVAYNDKYIGAEVAPTPLTLRVSNLLDLIQREDVDDEFYLSSNAATGILRRVDNAHRTLFAPLRAALEVLAQQH